MVIVDKMMMGDIIKKKYAYANLWLGGILWIMIITFVLM